MTCLKNTMPRLKQSVVKRQTCMAYTTSIWLWSLVITNNIESVMTGLFVLNK